MVNKEITDCARDDKGITWCWDDSTKDLIRVDEHGRVRHVKIENAPVDIIATLLHKQHEMSCECNKE